jgi:hypothetical protein
MKIPRRQVLPFFSNIYYLKELKHKEEWFKIVTSNGGVNNIILLMIVPITMSIPSNNLELALWMESERLHASIINQIGSTRRTGLSRKKNSLRQPTLRENLAHRKGKYV